MTTIVFRALRGATRAVVGVATVVSAVLIGSDGRPTRPVADAPAQKEFRPQL